MPTQGKASSIPIRNAPEMLIDERVPRESLARPRSDPDTDAVAKAAPIAPPAATNSTSRMGDLLGCRRRTGSNSGTVYWGGGAPSLAAPPAPAPR